MARITVEDCVDKFESRFELVLVASNRARKLHSGETPTVEKDNDKPTVIALREIADDSLSVDSLKDKLIQEYQTVSPIDEEDLSLDYANSETEMKEEKPEDVSHLNDGDNEAKVSNEDQLNEGEGEGDIILPGKNDGSNDTSDDNNPEN